MPAKRVQKENIIKFDSLPVGFALVP